MAEGFDSGFELLPSDEPELSPDEERQALLGVELDEDEDDAPAPFGRGHAFDYENNQFFRHGDAPAVVYGEMQLRQWIEKVLGTARITHPVYSEGYGTDWPPNLIGQVFSAELAGGVRAAIESALLEHDRITQVKDFDYSGGPLDDLLAISFTVVLDEEELTIDNLPIPRTVA